MINIEQQRKNQLLCRIVRYFWTMLYDGAKHNYEQSNVLRGVGTRKMRCRSTLLERKESESTGRRNVDMALPFQRSRLEEALSLSATRRESSSINRSIASIVPGQILNYLH